MFSVSNLKFAPLTRRPCDPISKTEQEQLDGGDDEDEDYNDDDDDNNDHDDDDDDQADCDDDVQS